MDINTIASQVDRIKSLYLDISRIENYLQRIEEDSLDVPKYISITIPITDPLGTSYMNYNIDYKFILSQHKDNIEKLKEAKLELKRLVNEDLPR